MVQQLFPAGITGATVQTATPVGAERDELTQLVMRLKQADARRQAPSAPTRHAAPAPTAQALDWAQTWALPREVHEYFVLEQAS